MGKRVVVIGAGIIGACVARELTLAGAQVTVVEASEPATGASSRSMGWINASFIDREDYYRLRLAAMEAHRELDRAFDGALQTRWTGSINWEAAPESMEALVADLGRFGHPVKLIGKEEFARLEPEVADLPEKALLMGNEGHMDAAHAARLILAAAQAKGAMVLTGTPVEGLERAAHGGWKVCTPLGLLEADDVVIAAGIRTGDLCSAAGHELPMKNEPGVLIQTTPVPFTLNHLIWSPDVHFKQLPDGRLICGYLFSGAITDGGEVDGVAHRMLARLKERLPRVADSLAIETVKHGVRPMPVDGYPSIGRLGEGADTDLYVSVLHSGVTLGPVVGRLVTREIMTGARDPLLAGFSPGRFNG